MTRVGKSIRLGIILSLTVASIYFLGRHLSLFNKKIVKAKCHTVMATNVSRSAEALDDESQLALSERQQSIMPLRLFVNRVVLQTTVSDLLLSGGSERLVCLLQTPATFITATVCVEPSYSHAAHNAYNFASEPPQQLMQQQSAVNRCALGSATYPSLKNCAVQLTQSAAYL